MARYVPRRIEIQAWQWNGQPLTDWPERKYFLDAPIAYVEAEKGLVYLSIDTPFGMMRIHPGDYIVKTDDGFYPSLRNIFEKNYERLPTVHYGI